MEIFHVRLSGAALAASRRPIEVSHAETGLGRRLLPREEVVVSDLGGDFHSARVLVVADADADAEPTYFLHVGTRLSLDEAARRLDDDRHGALARIGLSLHS